MIFTTALALAGPGSTLVGRPHSPVGHVYTGSLSPSGRCSPRRGRTVCRAHTRTLYRVELGMGPLDPDSRRVCRRCVAVLEKGKPRTATPPPATREEWTAHAEGLDGFDLALGAWLAETPEEVDRVAYLGMLTLGWAGLHNPIVTPAGKTIPPLKVWVTRARTRVRAPAGIQAATVNMIRAYSLMAAEQRIREAGEARRERDSRRARLGYANTT